MLALCLTTFISGCVKTETVIVTKTVGTLPPPYLYAPEKVPEVPPGLAPGERTAYLIEGYASRGDALKRANGRFETLEDWVERIRELYPETVVEPVPEGEQTTNAPEGSGSDET